MGQFGGDRNVGKDGVKAEEETDIQKPPLEWILVQFTKAHESYYACILYDPPDIVERGIFARNCDGDFIYVSKTFCDSRPIAIKLSGIFMGKSFEDSRIQAQAWFKEQLKKN